MEIESTLKDIRRLLTENIDQKTVESEKRYFKEEIKTYGVSVYTVSKLGKQLLEKIKNNPKTEIFSLCEELWKSGFMEEAFLGCDFAYSQRKSFEKKDFEIFEHWVNNYVSNWATCDTLCNHTIGTFITMYPEYIAQLKKWAFSPNRWTRRAAAVTLIIPARNGLFIDDILEIAQILLLDKDDLVQKGYGWMLKAASQANTKVIFDFVISKKDVMPRTALRYAIEKMPGDMKKEAMKR